MMTFLEGGTAIGGLASWLVILLPLLLILMILFFEIKGMAQNFGRYKNTLIRLGGILVVFLLCWVLAKSAGISFDGKDITEKMGLSKSQIKMVGGLVGLMVVGTLIAFLLLIGSLIRGMITNK